MDGSTKKRVGQSGNRNNTSIKTWSHHDFTMISPCFKVSLLTLPVSAQYWLALFSIDVQSWRQNILPSQWLKVEPIRRELDFPCQSQHRFSCHGYESMAEAEARLINSLSLKIAIISWTWGCGNDFMPSWSFMFLFCCHLKITPQKKTNNQDE